MAYRKKYKPLYFKIQVHLILKREFDEFKTKRAVCQEFS